MSGSWVYVTWHVLYVLRCSSSVVVALIVAITIVSAIVTIVVIVVVAIVIATVAVVIVSSLVVCGCHHVVLPQPFVLLSVIRSPIFWVVPSKPMPGSFFR